MCYLIFDLLNIIILLSWNQTEKQVSADTKPSTSQISVQGSGVVIDQSLAAVEVVGSSQAGSRQLVVEKAASKASGGSASIKTGPSHSLCKAQFTFKRNRLHCVRCVNENRKKRKRLRWQAVNHGCHCFDRAFLLSANRNARSKQWQAIAFEWKPGLI